MGRASVQSYDSCAVWYHTYLPVFDADRTVAAMPLLETQAEELRVFRRRALVSGVEFPAHALLSTALVGGQARPVEQSLLAHAQFLARSARSDEIRIGTPTMLDGVRPLSGFNTTCGITVPGR